MSVTITLAINDSNLTINCQNMSETKYSLLTIDVKNVFYVFFILVTFLFLKTLEKYACK